VRRSRRAEPTQPEPSRVATLLLLQRGRQTLHLHVHREMRLNMIDKFWYSGRGAL
jgi:hypothetical protein